MRISDWSSAVCASDLGERRRAAIARALAQNPDVLLPDEPTNDLDFAGLDLLESFVASTSSAVVTVSHDRAFLDRAVNRILELRMPAHDAVEPARGCSDFVESRELARRHTHAGSDKCNPARDRQQPPHPTPRGGAAPGGTK